MTKDKSEENHNCDNVNCNHNDTKCLCCLFNPDNCKYRQLQKENAELKGQVEMSYEVYNDNLDYSYHIEKQLTKAKKIIGEFVEWANWQGNSKCPSFKSIQDKAEAFLNSEMETKIKEKYIWKT